MLFATVCELGANSNGRMLHECRAWPEGCCELCEETGAELTRCYECGHDFCREHRSPLWDTCRGCWERVYEVENRGII